MDSYSLFITISLIIAAAMFVYDVVENKLKKDKKN